MPTSAPRRRSLRRLAAALVPVVAVAASACLPTGPGNDLVSTETDGSQRTRPSRAAAISRDGRYVAFSSDTESFSAFGASQVFRKDRATGEVVLVSQTTAGAPFPGRNNQPTISADGTKIAWVRTTLDPRGINELRSVFVRDLTTATTTLVSRSSTGAERSGRDPDISSDGRYVAFWTFDALVSGDTNGDPDVYRFDLVSGSMVRASVTRLGGQLPDGGDLAAISGDGRFVAFRTTTNLETADTDSDEDVYVRDMVTGATTFEGIGGFGTDAGLQVDISDDGRVVAFISDDGPAQRQAWVRDRATRQLRLVSPRAGTTEPGNSLVIDLGISRDGGHVAYSSASDDLVAGDTNGEMDVFVATTSGTEVVLVSRDPSGGLLDRTSQGRAVADGGDVVAFQTESDDVVAGDTNGVQDVFVNRRS